MTQSPKNAFDDKHYQKSVWDKIIARIDQEEKIKRMPFPWIRYAAALIIMVSGAFLADVVINKTESSSAKTAAQFRIINPTNKSFKATMQDGSKIVLFPNSELVYNHSFNKSDRDITLKGKARFEVARNVNMPFRVFSKSVVTTALGTSFTIVSDSLLNEVNVFLHTGKVLVSRNGIDAAKVYLEPGQHVCLNIYKGLPIVRNEIPLNQPRSILTKQPFTSPKKFSLVCEQEPLIEVLNKMAAGFSISIDYAPEEINSLYFSGTILSTEDPVRVLQRIAAMHNLVLKEEKNRYLLRKIN